jgi:hypothetical protein
LIAETAIIVLTILLLLEVCVLIVAARHILLKPFDRDEAIKPEGREYATRALNLGALSFAGIALLAGTYATSLDQISGSLLILVFGLGLFFISYSVETLVRLRRIVWVVQDKTLSFGYLSILIGLAAFFYVKLPIVFPVVVIITTVISLISLIEFRFDYKHWREREVGRNQTPVA